MSSLRPNTVAFIGLCNEFRIAMESAREAERDCFVDSMLRLLPRIYISATDLRPDSVTEPEEAYLAEALDEDYYESVRRSVEVVFNFLHTASEATDETMALAVSAMTDDFRSYWSATLCNVLRALNHLRYNHTEEF